MELEGADPDMTSDVEGSDIGGGCTAAEVDGVSIPNFTEFILYINCYGISLFFQ